MSRQFGTSILLPGVPTATNEAATKGYVDAEVADATNVTSGQFDNARMPQVSSLVRAVNPSAGTISINASTVGNNINSTGSSTTTLNVPTNGADGQVIQLILYASTGFTLTFHASYTRLTGIAATLVIATGKIARAALRCTNASGSLHWIVESVGVEQ